jgi:transcriptional regulator with XRE-family HTH domain
MLATKVGTHQAHIANIENGVKNPSLRLLVALATALDVTVDELVSEPASTTS